MSYTFAKKKLTFACCSIRLTRIRSAKGTTLRTAVLAADKRETVARILFEKSIIGWGKKEK
jgi:hypothetical protein